MTETRLPPQATFTEQPAEDTMNDYLARQLQWLGSQCECETLDGVGLCIACGIQITLRRQADDARMMQSLTGEWMWATPLSGITTQTPSSDPDSAEWWRDVAQQLAYQLYYATKGAAMGDSMKSTIETSHSAALLTSEGPAPTTPEPNKWNTECVQCGGPAVLIRGTEQSHVCFSCRDTFYHANDLARMETPQPAEGPETPADTP